MATTNPSLFGMLGDEEALQRQLDEQRAKAFAEQTQEQRLASMGYSAGAGLGRGIAGAFGVDVTDPVVRQATQLRQLASEFDTTIPEGMMKFAQAARSISPDVAQKAAQEAQAMQLKSAEITAKTAEKMTNEQRNALALVASAGLDVRTPEGAKAYNEALKGLTSKTGSMSDLAKLITERAALDPNDNETRALYDAKIKKLTSGKTMAEELGAGIATGFGMLGQALAPALKKEGEETGTFAAKDFNALGAAVASGTASKRNIQVMDAALKNAFTGKFSDTKENIITSLTGMNISVGDDLKQAATNTQLINAMGTRYVFPLVKNFPGSLAAKELDRLEKTAPGSLQQPETIRTLMNLLKVDLAENEFVYNKAKEYKTANKGSAINFNQADARIDFQNKLNSLRTKVDAARKKGSLSSAEKAEIEAIKKEIGVE